MSQMNTTGIKTFLAATALEPWRLVMMTAAGTVGYAGVGNEDDVVGVTQHSVSAAGDQVSVALLNRPGTQKVTASAAITVNLELNCAANGKVAVNGAETVRIGRALEAATADDHVIEAVLGFQAAG